MMSATGLREQVNRVAIDFVKAELDISAVFATIAAQSTDPARVSRNMGNALTGYRTALHFIPSLRVDPAERKLIRDKLAELDNLLTALGVAHDSPAAQMQAIKS